MDFALLIGAAFVFYAFNNAQTSAMPSYMMDMGGSAFLASAQTSLFIVAAVVLRLLFGPLSDRRGPRFVMVVGALGFTLPCAVLPLCGELWQVVALRACQAVGLAAFHPCVSLAVSRMSDEARLGTRLGTVRFASTLSLMVGPVLLFKVIEASGYRAFFAALCALGLVGIALLVPMRDGSGAKRPVVADACRADAESPDTARPGTEVSGVFALPRAHVPLLVFPFVCAMGYGAILNFGKMLVSTSMPEVNDGLVFTFVSLGGLAGSLLCGRLADKAGTRPIVAGCLCFVSVGALVLSLAHGLGLLAVGGVLFGLGYFGATTVLTAALARAVGPLGKGSALSLQQSSLDLGLAVGSLCAGWFVQMSGSATMAFLVSAAVLAFCVPAWLIASRVPGRTRAAGRR